MNWHSHSNFPLVPSKLLVRTVETGPHLFDRVLPLWKLITAMFSLPSMLPFFKHFNIMINTSYITACKELLNSKILWCIFYTLLYIFQYHVKVCFQYLVMYIQYFVMYYQYDVYSIILWCMWNILWFYSKTLVIYISNSLWCIFDDLVMYIL